MVLKQIFECPRNISRLRSGPLGKLLEGFCNWLLGHGFSAQRSVSISFVYSTLTGTWATQSVASARALVQEMLRPLSRSTLCDAGIEEHWKNTFVEFATR